MLTITKPNINRELGVIASAFQNVIVWSETQNCEEKMRQEFLNTFQQSDKLQQLIPLVMQQTTVSLLFDFRRDPRKIRLCLLQLNNCIINDSKFENAFMGLQI